MTTASLVRAAATAALLANALLGCEADIPGPDTTAVESPPKLLLIGLDGADLRWVDRLAGEGRLPHLGGLIDRGVSAALETVHYASPIIWTSVATGVVPRRHGIGGFLIGDRDAVTPEPVELPSGHKRPVTVAQRRRPAFWNILTHYGKSVGVLAWWATYPAERVHGYMLSPYLFFGLPDRQGAATVRLDWSAEDRGKAFPPELGEEIHPMMYESADIDVTRHADVLGREGETQYTLWGLARDRSYYEAALHLLAERPVDCVAVYFQGIDVASHDYTYFAIGDNVNEKREPKVSAAAAARGLARVEAMYEEMDAMVGGLLERVSDETDVIVVSDHGWNYDGTSHWNLDPGVFIAAGPSFEQGLRVEGVSVVDIAPVLLAALEAPVARAFDGKVPAGVLRPEREATVVHVDDYPIPPFALDADAPTGAKEDESMLDLLRGLGYIE